MSAEDAGDARVVQFSPQGEVKGVRQVTARFSEPMVALGDPRSGVDPFDVSCPEAGVGRWVDSANWAYDFERDLPAGIRCAFSLRPNLETLGGVPLRGVRDFHFSTGGPAILRSFPYEGMKAIEEDQVFVLALDAEPAVDSVLRNVGFHVAGLPERIGVRVVEGELRDRILDELPSWFPKEHRIVLQARQSFPNETAVSLVWGAGVSSRGSVATSQDQVLAFKTRKAFTATFTCTRENERSPCHPVTDMRVDFSAPVPKKSALRAVMIAPDGQRRRAGDEDEGDESDWNYVNGVDFRGPFPEDATFQIKLPADLADEAGRTLVNADRFPLTVRTGPYPPLAKFSSRFGIIEWKADPALPVTLRNLELELRTRLLAVDGGSEKGLGERAADIVDRAIGRVFRITPERQDEILAWLRRVATARRERSLFADLGGDESVKTMSLPKPNGAKAFEVVGIPFSAPGLYVVEIESPRLGASLLGKAEPMYVPAAALVTNLAVHFKRAGGGSLVWVTTLDEGKPVGGAEVAIHDCRGGVVWQGATDDDGLAQVDALPSDDALPRCHDPSPGAARIPYYDYPLIQALRSLDSGLLVTARVGEDSSFVHSSWDDGIEPWRFKLPEDASAEPIVARTILDRSLLRAGDTLHMKHVLRGRTLHGFSAVAPESRPTTVSIRHLGSDERY
ncbi:MAG: alpha-2-macroglobulin, partial [Candidatus Binatia bacterium]